MSAICKRKLANEEKYMRNQNLTRIYARTKKDDLLTWYYLIFGDETSEFKGGLYMGRLVFPGNYPLAPPKVFMDTPNGRYKQGTFHERGICMTMSDWHPESWNPSWKVVQIITSIQTFMVCKDASMHYNRHIGAISDSTQQRVQYAKNSWNFNKNDPNFREVYPDLLPMCEEGYRADRTWEEIYKILKSNE